MSSTKKSQTSRTGLGSASYVSARLSAGLMPAGLGTRDRAPSCSQETVREASSDRPSIWLFSMACHRRYHCAGGHAKTSAPTRLDWRLPCVTTGVLRRIGMKKKPANHLFRVGTDDDRRSYRTQRAEELRALLEPRERLASAIAPNAAVAIPHDDGYAVCAQGTVAGTDTLVGLARETVEQVDLAAKKADANKPFMVKLLDMKRMTLDSPLLQFGLRRDIVAAAARYLGTIPILQYANVVYSSHVAGELSKSQLYHCDSDEAQQVKIFVICETVTQSEGPLTFLTAAQSQLVRDRVQYRYKYRLTDEDVRAAVGTTPREVALTGPAGTLAFLDTSRCFHYGSRIASADTRRLVVMLQYVTPLAFILPDYPAGTTFGGLADAGRDEVERLVLGAAA